MAPSEGIPSDLDEKSFESIVKFVSNVRTGKLQGSITIAHATVDLLEQIISDADNTTALVLCRKIRAVGCHLTEALPAELSAGNMVRRVLRAIRDEQRANVNQSVEGAGESLQRLVLANPGRRATIGPASKDLKEPLRDFIAELRAELESSLESVCSQAKEHIAADELVMTHGAGALLERFLRAAGRKYRLVLAEGPDVREDAMVADVPQKKAKNRPDPYQLRPPQNLSHAMAARLSAAGVSVTVVTAAAAPALVSRVNKVVIAATATVGGGAVIAPVGTALITNAATHRAVPVIVLCPLLKLSPVQSCDQYFFKAQDTSHQAMPYQGLECVDATVVAQKFDFIRPNQVSLVITNLGGSSPSYVYRLLSELYDPDDYML